MALRAASALMSQELMLSLKDMKSKNLQDIAALLKPLIQMEDIKLTLVWVSNTATAVLELGSNL